MINSSPTEEREKKNDTNFIFATVENNKGNTLLKMRVKTTSLNEEPIKKSNLPVLETSNNFIVIIFAISHENSLQ